MSFASVLWMVPYSQVMAPLLVLNPPWIGKLRVYDVEVEDDCVHIRMDRDGRPVRITFFDRCSVPHLDPMITSEGLFADSAHHSSAELAVMILGIVPLIVLSPLLAFVRLAVYPALEAATGLNRWAMLTCLKLKRQLPADVFARLLNAAREHERWEARERKRYQEKETEDADDLENP